MVQILHPAFQVDNYNKMHYPSLFGEDKTINNLDMVMEHLFQAL